MYNHLDEIVYGLCNITKSIEIVIVSIAFVRLEGYMYGIVIIKRVNSR